jgi:hypothetical protein
MSQQVDSILEQIERLDNEDRLLLQQRLNDLAETEWPAEAKQARAVALELGINQQSIDQAVQGIR